MDQSMEERCRDMSKVGSRRENANMSSEKQRKKEADRRFKCFYEECKT